MIAPQTSQGSSFTRAKMPRATSYVSLVSCRLVRGQVIRAPKEAPGRLPIVAAREDHACAEQATTASTPTLMGAGELWM